MKSGRPAYLDLERGEIADRAETARRRLASCDICARRCGANRLESAEDAACNTAAEAIVSNASAHFGEEDPLVGTRGSGTIFFSWCNLKCKFCQNYDISQQGLGRTVSASELASLMLALQRQGCHNINFVTPSHVVPQILAALDIAVKDGLTLPLVYNTGGYDNLDTLKLLDGVVDIYMPDMKYADAEVALRYSGVSDYPAVNRATVKEMHRQVGDLAADEGGVAISGLLVRHLVLPDRLAGTREIVNFLRDEISANTYINVMAQYRPCYRADELPSLDRGLSTEEYREAVQLAADAGLRLDQRRPRLLWGI